MNSGHGMTAPGLKGLKFDLAKLQNGGDDVGIHVEEKNGKVLQDVEDNENAKLIKLVTSWPENKQLEEQRKEVNQFSTNVATATFFGCCCCLYNCCCCCFSAIPFCKPWCGPCCGTEFCFSGRLNCLQINMRRDRWLWVAHMLCFVLHFTLMCVTIAAGWRKPMEVTLFRIKPEWESTGRNGFNFKLVDNGSTWLRLDTTTALFFFLSAFFHGVWVFLGPWQFSIPFLWKQLDNCLCYWRWLEYSLSASLMLMCLAVSMAVREEQTLIGVFALCATTMFFGYATEVHSRPSTKKGENGENVYDFERWEGQPEEGEDNYMRKRVLNYIYRMQFHFFGILPYMIAWYLLLGQFFRQLNELPADMEIPSFVFWAIIGTFLVFSLFTFVQWRYQWVAPKHYWKTELWYCFLSATSKAYLGFILLWNVILQNSFDEAVSPDINMDTNTSRLFQSVASLYAS
jgi:hypothetical protein